jgi:iron complex outermembrane receptor protein
VAVSTKNLWDAYALWTFSPAAALRLLGSNLAPRETISTTIDDVRTASGANERTTVRSLGPSFVNWQLRLELKL